MSIFSSLNTAVSGLQTAQTGVNVTSNNISNAENKNYTRQRVVQKSNTPIANGNVLVDSGVDIKSISRVHDEFVYTRYQQNSERTAYIDTLKTNLEEVSSYFPEMEGVGIDNDLQDYYRSWSSLAQDPSSDAQKSVVISSAENLSTNIRNSYDKLDNLQESLNQDIKTSVDEVNFILKNIAELNGEIEGMEVDGSTANELRDQRDSLETTLSRLVGATFVHGNISDSGDNPTLSEAEGLYSVIIGGVAVVSGTSYHELKIDNTSSKSGYYSIGLKTEDGLVTDMTSQIKKGKVGAMLELRGSEFDENGEVTNGLITEYKDKLNIFTEGLIESTNSIYAESASQKMVSDRFDNVSDTSNLIETLGVNSGNFNIKIYDKDGNEVGTRTVSIDETTTLNSPVDENSLMKQLQASYDDSGDGSLSNDFASQFDVTFNNGQLVISAKNPDSGYTFGIEDNGTNFAGSLGLNRFFEGTDASNIKVKRELSNSPQKLTAFKQPVEGDNGVADGMSRLETENWLFKSEKYGDSSGTILNAYKSFSVDLSSKTETISNRQETIKVQFTAIEQRLQDISKVSIDDELTNLMKYQTAYSAAGKVISTIDQMIDTLLGLK